MALIVCTECNKQFSDKAPACPNCGCPTDVIMSSRRTVERKVTAQNLDKEEYPAELRDYLEKIRILESDIYTMDEIISNLREEKKTDFPKQTAVRKPDFEAIQKQYIEAYARKRQSDAWRAQEEHERICGRLGSSDYWTRRERQSVSSVYDFEKSICLKKFQIKDKDTYFREEFLLKARANTIGNPFTLKKRLDGDYEQYIASTESHNKGVEFRVREINSLYEAALTSYNREVEDNEKNRIICEQSLVFNAGIDQQIINVEAEKQETATALKRLYDVGIVYPKYRGLIPITMFCEYIASGRRTELEGIHGMYDLYEAELLGQKIVGELSKINMTLSLISYQIGGIANQLHGIARNQVMLYEEVARGNDIAKRISADTTAMLEKTNSVLSAVNGLSKEISTIKSSAEMSAYNTEIAAHRLDSLSKIQEYEYSLRHPIFRSV